MFARARETVETAGRAVNGAVVLAGVALAVALIALLLQLGGHR
jgi:hypothetical protein